MTSETPDAKLVGRKPNLFQAFLPIAVLVGLLATNVSILGDAALSGANQLALLAAASVAAGIGLYNGLSWAHINKGILTSMGAGMGAVLILLNIGALTGTWLISGVVPAMIYYGLGFLHPSIFLVASFVVCSVVSMATGSSWSTVGTIGIALLAIGGVLGFPTAMVAGAVISGAYFGDKLSPLSDTSSLAAAITGTDLFVHTRYMVLTTIPTTVIVLVLFVILGFTVTPSSDLSGVETVRATIDQNFQIHPGLFVIPLFVIVLIIRKAPTFPTLLAGTVLAGVFAVAFQPQMMLALGGAEGSYALKSFKAVMQALTTEVHLSTGDATVDKLLVSKGMGGMLTTVWLVLFALLFGGVMEACGLLRRITDGIISLVRSTTQLVAATVGTSILTNLTASEQYLSIVIPGRMFSEAYTKRGLKPENLSRTLEDSGTVTSPLVPWTTCGAYNSGVLGVATLSYLPFCFFCLVSPLTTIAFAALNIRIARLSNSKPDALPELASDSANEVVKDNPE